MTCIFCDQFKQLFGIALLTKFFSNKNVFNAPVWAIATVGNGGILVGKTDHAIGLGKMD